MGTVASGRLRFRYCQVDRQGDVHGGHSTCDVTRLPEGRLRVEEHFHWESREGNGTNVLEALALVWDGDIWSVLEPVPGPEPLRVFAFHFPGGIDNSGFVGWLATRLKTVLGTGVLVVCGFNSRRGRAFDYGCVPEAVGEDAIAEIHRLRGEEP